MCKKPLFVLIALIVVACSKQPVADDGTRPGTTGTSVPVENSNLIKGADVSWLTQMEASDQKFYNSSGTQQDGMQILKDLGMNAMRLRVWVNPSNGWCNTADLVAKAIRVKARGMKLLLDIHYSDSWADPGKQIKPAAWVGKTFPELLQAISVHTASVLSELKKNDITPEWVQVGNETNDGMLWPDGKASVNMNSFAQMINAGYDAVKAADPAIKVMVHVSNGYDNSLFRWMFDGLKANGAKYDIIGMSLYPTSANWSALNAQCFSNMNDMVSRYGKDVMVVEVGMSWTDATACNSFLTDLLSKVKNVTGGKGLGVFYWEPEAYNNWQGYSLGAFDNSGKPTVALNAFN